MGAIEWTDRSDWNPVRGCTRVSPGCGGPGLHGGCYAEGMAARFSKPGMWGHGFAEMKDGKPRWTGRVELLYERLVLPLRWKKSAKIFINSTSDLFHEQLPDDDIAMVVAYIAASYWHIHQVLTKRSERARDLFNDEGFREKVGGILDAVDVEAQELGLYDPLARRSDDWRAQCPDVQETWPLPNLWLGASTEDQQRADERIPLLLQTPAAVRFVSAEPLLGPIDLSAIRRGNADGFMRPLDGRFNTLDWVIVGGESGPRARPMRADWARSLRDQCANAEVPFFFKQWGEWIDADEWRAKLEKDGIQADWATSRPLNFSDAVDLAASSGHSRYEHHSDGSTLIRVGKAAAGRLLDGVEHHVFPEVRS